MWPGVGRSQDLPRHGRAYREELKFNRITAGAAQDIEVASRSLAAWCASGGCPSRWVPWHMAERTTMCSRAGLHHAALPQLLRGHGHQNRLRDSAHRAGPVPASAGLLRANASCWIHRRSLLSYEVWTAKEINVLMAHDDLAAYATSKDE